MELAAGQTAVITGAGSGIGRALAMACAQRGLNVVAADLDAGRLESLASELNGIGGELLCQSVDVASRESISALAELAYQRFGQVELLFNNAGMLRSGRCWETSYEEWQRVMDVNVMSVLHGIQVFVPRMLAQGGPAHIVNTASMAGLLASPRMGAYSVSKHAVVALSQTLHYELQEQGAEIGVSVACPAQVQSNIMQDVSDPDAATGQLNDFLRSGVAAGMPADQLAALMLAAVEQQRFWIFSHDDFKGEYRRRAEELLNDQNPQFQMAICE